MSTPSWVLMACIGSRCSFQAVSLAHPPSCVIGIDGCFSEDKAGRGVKLTTHLHLVPKLRLSRAVPLLPPYAFMAAQEQLYHYIYIYIQLYSFQKA
jgi:hypothetical protein